MRKAARRTAAAQALRVRTFGALLRPTQPGVRRGAARHSTTEQKAQQADYSAAPPERRRAGFPTAHRDGKVEPRCDRLRRLVVECDVPASARA
jgi:hypothetical protein